MIGTGGFQNAAPRTAAFHSPGLLRDAIFGIAFTLTAVIGILIATAPSTLSTMSTGISLYPVSFAPMKRASTTNPSRVSLRS